jgi:SpoVK/Ycf46/Vps4 family AAA+-type ATPase
VPKIELLIELIEAHVRGTEEEFERLVDEAARQEEAKKNFTAAIRIRNAFAGARANPASHRNMMLKPVSSRTSSLPISPLAEGDQQLISRLPSSIDLADVILPESLQDEIRNLLVEWQREAELAKVGLTARRKLLLYGPPGCGKTMLAQALSTETDLPLYIVRFDTLISSYLGQTGSNIREVFGFVEKHSCILLIDELDAVAKLRDDSQELGEIKRVVITLLQNIDLLDPRAHIVAATNHPQLLDPAVWRRFDVALEIPLPGFAECRRLLEKEASRFSLELDAKDVESIARLLQGRSCADITRLTADSVRLHVVKSGEKPPRYEFIEAMMQRLLKEVDAESGGESHEMKVGLALKLRQMNPHRYTLNELAKITGIPRSTLGYRTKQARERVFEDARAPRR